MAERRMMAKSVIETDHFMDMPMSSQCLYFHLLLRADDDGFITSPRRIMREVGCHEDDMKLLVAKNYIIPFDSGVIVIKHWKIHNFIRSDRYTPTHCDERAQVELTKKKIYELKTPDVDVLTTSTGTSGMTCGIPTGIPTGTPVGNQAVTGRDTQVRLGKVRLGKVRLIYLLLPLRVRARARRTRILTENSDMSSRSMPTMSIQPMGLSSPTNCYPSTTSTTASGWRRPLSRQPSRRQDRI